MSFKSSPFTAMVAVLIASLSAPSVARAQTDYYWNAPTGGAGTWNTATANWSTTSAGPTDYTWTNSGSERANFGGTGDTVTLGTAITAHSLVFSATGYTIAGDTLTLAGAGGVIDTGTFNATINSILDGTVGLTKTGTGTLTLGGANLYTGVTTVSGGVVLVTNAAGLGATGAANNTVVSSGAAVEVSGAITVAEALTLNGTGVSDGGALRKTGTDTTIWSGALTLASASRIQSEAGQFTISGALTGNQALTFGGAGNTTVSSAIAATAVGVITKVGTGTLTLSATNAWTGALTVEAGMVSIPTSTTLGTAGTITLNGGTLRQTNPGNAGSFVSATRPIVIGSNGGTVEYSPSGLDYSFVTIFTPSAGNAIKGEGNTLTKTGVGEFRYNGAERANTNFARLVVNQGLFRLGDSGAGNNFEQGYGAIPTAYTPDAITLNGGSIGASFAITIDANRGITLGPNGGTINTSASTVTVPSLVIGDGRLNKGGGTLILQNAGNQYLGGTSFAGTLTVASLANGGSASAIGASSSAAENLILHGGTLNYTGPATSTDRLFTVTSAGGTLNSSGTGPVTFANPGSHVAADMPTSAFTVQNTSSFVKLKSNGTAFDMTGITVGMAVSGAGIPAGATVTAVNATLAQFTLSAAATATNVDTPLTFTSSNRTLTLTGSNTGLNSIAGSLSNSPTTTLSVTKTGAGTWALSGPSTYTGATLISAGTLLANNTAGSGTGTGAVTVTTAGTLGGTGTIAGAVTVAGTLAPGASIGQLTVDNNVTFSTGSSLAAELGANAGGTADNLRLTGTARILNFGATGDTTLRLSPDGFTGSAGGPATFVLASLPADGVVQVNAAPATGTIGSFVVGSGSSGPVTINPSLLTGLVTGDSFQLTSTGTAVTLTFTPVPEPATVLGLSALAAGAFGALRRRRR